MPRVIARQGQTAYLVETGTNEYGRSLGVVYDDSLDVVHPEMLVASIAARGYWQEVDPDDYAVLADRLAERLPGA